MVDLTGMALLEGEEIGKKENHGEREGERGEKLF